MRNNLLISMVLLLSAACATGPRSAAPRASAPPLDSELATLRETMAADLERSRPAHDSDREQIDAAALTSIEMPSHVSVERAVRYFSTTLKPGIQSSLYRSSRYRGMIDPILDHYGLPRALAYLPVIESGYRPTLTSKAGARGIWQFMPATAREYGLRVDWWVDERIDAEKSTVAAARYLKDLHRMFSDWPLALAAYNAGPGRVRRTLAEHGVTTFWELLDRSALPKETRGYVPTFFATVAIVGDPQALGFELKPYLEDSQQWAPVDVVGPVSVEYLARVAGAPADAMQERNGRYHRGVVPPGRNPVLVPAQAASRIAARAMTLREDDDSLEIASYTLKRGDSLDTIARLLGTSTSELASMNGSRAGRYSAGDEIYLPVSQSRLSEMLLDRRSPARDFHLVNAGETLYSIARRYDVTIDSIQQLNDLPAGAVIHPGQRLRIPSGGGVTAGGM